jgi:hypothetical protein
VVLVGLGIPMLNISVNNYPAFQTRISNPGTLACTDLEPLWLLAQSVPSASLVPCLGSLPEGWELAKMTVNDGHSVITLYDRLDLATVVVRLTADCDVGGASLVPPGRPEVRRYLRTESVSPQFSATRFEVFPGGCVTTWLTVPDVHRDWVTSQAGALLGFTSRQTLQQMLEQRSDGRLHLDPS